MPFPFSHPALILPFKYFPRSWFSYTGLVIGSIVPDLEYIIIGTKTFSHTLIGIFCLDLPLALIVTFIFHNIVRDKLIPNLPSFMYSRFARFEGLSWNLYFRKHKAIVIFSILLGIATHLFWDSFTNVSGYFVIKFPVLQETVNVVGTAMPLYVLLWDLSSIAGILVIIIAVYLLPKEYKNRKYNIAWFWIFFILGTVLSSCLLLIKLGYTEIDAVSMIFLRSGLLFLLLISVLSKKTTIKSKP